MFNVVLQFAGSALVIVFAGTALSRFADEIAEATGFGRLLIGSVLLAGATSLPELAVDLHAVSLGLADVAIGDLMGSSLFNLLILGVLDLSHRSRGRMLSRKAAGHALAATGSMALTALAAGAILLGERAAPYAIGGVGIGSYLILAAYVICLRLIYYDRQVHAEALASEVSSEASPPSLGRAGVGFAIAAGAILLAAPVLAGAAGRFAELTGIGETFVGTVLVALCTSLPELVASVAAIRISAFDLAIGNVFGSNAINMMLLVPLDFVHDGPIMANVSEVHAVTGLATILITSVAVMGLLYNVEHRKPLLEPDAILVIVLVFATLLLVYSLSTGDGGSDQTSTARVESSRFARNSVVQSTPGRSALAFRSSI